MKIAYISNKLDQKDAWNDKVWQPMNYSDTMKTLKDQGIKTFKVWIDKTEYSKGKSMELMTKVDNIILLLLGTTQGMTLS
ncbi:hypothetical protein LEP1GSC132_2443 [Leptospira kirschneri str. 200803703]|nr:hypothetical protein LEP1GSC132_2443 [Leptospira kirschneri str. 200803703]